MLITVVGNKTIKSHNGWGVDVKFWTLVDGLGGYQNQLSVNKGEKEGGGPNSGHSVLT